MRISTEKLEGALLLIRQYCEEHECKNCALQVRGACGLIAVPGNWIIKKEDGRIIL